MVSSDLQMVGDNDDNGGTFVIRGNGEKQDVTKRRDRGCTQQRYCVVDVIWVHRLAEASKLTCSSGRPVDNMCIWQ